MISEGIIGVYNLQFYRLKRGISTSPEYSQVPYVRPYGSLIYVSNNRAMRKSQFKSSYNRGEAVGLR